MILKGLEMKINEIFYSIQGEGKWAGLPNVFIRTTGCNLRCSYCDTKYAYKSGDEMKIEEILNEICKYPCKSICITGGEPLIQDGILDLIDTLIKKDYKICFETNGSLDIVELSNKKSLMISLDVKCPSSNMHEKNFLKNINILRKEDQLKFIIANKEDYDYAKKIVKKYKPACSVFFHPVYGTNPIYLAKWIINDKLAVNLGLQLHKIIWGEMRKN
jgi:7-carboxy-7-deazaguanine synthase